MSTPGCDREEGLSPQSAQPGSSFRGSRDRSIQISGQGSDLDGSVKGITGSAGQLACDLMRPRQIADMLGLGAFGRSCERIVWGGIGRTMLSGFNTNFRYRGVLFHVQTEDSGHGNPHIITHLFHGGNILASRKSEYADLLGGAEAELEDAVRKRMEAQHKTMLKSLSRGEHDAVISERLGADALEAPTAKGAEGRDTTDAAVSSESSMPGPGPAAPSAPAASTPAAGASAVSGAGASSTAGAQSPAGAPRRGSAALATGS